MEYFDKLAEASVREAIEGLAASGKRASSQSVPPAAARLLAQKGRGRLSQTDADKKIQQAVDRMRERKEIKAPRAPYNDWALIVRQPRPPSAS